MYQRKLKHENLKPILLELFLGYETQKVVQIHSKPIGLMNRFVQFSILIYIVLWVMWWERGYQAADTIISGTSVKVSGGPLFNGDVNEDLLFSKHSKVWDITDVVVPPQQNSGFFITTNVIVTPNQTQSYCAESHSIKSAHCHNDSECKQGYIDNNMHGPFTGRCIADVGRCEIFGWCPVEEVSFGKHTTNSTDRHENISLVDDNKNQIFYNVLNYTALISNTVKFRSTGIKRRNFIDTMTEDNFEKCRYHPVTSPFCPVFRIGDIFRWASDKNDEASAKDKYSYKDSKEEIKAHYDLLSQGGIIAISIDWTCDFDRSIEECVPKYTFTRLQAERERANDDDEEAQAAGLASGWSIHHSSQYEKSGIRHRILTKAIGVQFFIHTTGKGWRFDLATFTMNCGSGLALFGGATFFCDMILLYILKKRKLYRQAKCDVLTTYNAKSSVDGTVDNSP